VENNKIETKAGVVMEAVAAFGGLLNQPFPVKAALALSRLSQKLEAAWTPIEQARAAIAFKVSGGAESVPPEKFRDYLTQVRELQEQPAIVEADPVVLSAALDVKLSPQQVRALELFVKFE